MRQYTYSNMPCGSPVSTDCVLYVGSELKTQVIDPTCLLNLTEIVQKIDVSLDAINKNIDITKIKSCLTIDVTKATIGDFLQAIASSLCSIKEDLTRLKNQTAQDLLATPVQIDLSCLGNSCDSAGSTTLLTVLTTLSRELCDLKSQNNSNAGFYQP